MTVEGARIVHSKQNIIIALLSYTPIQISHISKLQMRCQVSGTGVARKQLQRFHKLCYSEAQNPASEVKVLMSSSEVYSPQNFS